jgi:hypothetical protein
MSVHINVTKQVYDFIDGTTGQKITAEEFAKKYPGVGLGGHAVGNGQKKVEEGSGEDKK